MANRTILPSDQFERCVEELRKATMLVEEIQRAADVASGIDKEEVRSRLVKAKDAFEIAGFHLDKAIKAAMK